MKNGLLLLFVLLGFGINAADWSDEELRCAKGVYCIEDMTCITHIDGEPPKGMHPDYYTAIVWFKSYKSVKNLAGSLKTLVDTLGSGEEYMGVRPDLTLEEALQWEPIIYNYGSPAYRDGNVVNMSLGGFSEGLQLEITNVDSYADYEIHRLRGRESIVGDVVSDHAIVYDCQAKIVEKPSGLIDSTR